MKSKSALIREALKSGETAAQIAKRMGIDRKYVNVVGQRPAPSKAKAVRHAEEIIALWNAGRNGKEIAEKLRIDPTCITMFLRRQRAAGVSLRPVPAQISKPKPEPKRASRAPVMRESPAPPPIRLIAIDRIHGLASTALGQVQKHDGCRYPIGEFSDPDFRFCGAERHGSEVSYFSGGEAYCPRHKSITSAQPYGSLAAAEKMPRLGVMG